MSDKSEIILNGKSYSFPVVVGSENEHAIDITKLRKETAFITLDNGFGNTGACESSITFLDGEKAILRYRGYPIEQICSKLTFLETAYLLIYDKLPKGNDVKDFEKRIDEKCEIPDGIKEMIRHYPNTGHPMGILSSSISALTGFYPDLTQPKYDEERFNEAAEHLLAKIITISAYIYKNLSGQDFVAPDKEQDYIDTFLKSMFSTRDKDFEVSDAMRKAVNVLLILHADHEQNCSTSAVRLIGSSWSNLFSSVSGGVGALWGPLHGGANQKVVEMLQAIHDDGGDIQKYIEKAKDPDDNYRLMGFGHRVYKNYDPRAKIIKKYCLDLFDQMKLDDPLLDIAQELEAKLLKDDYFVQRKLYPNVDFYSGLIYKALGIPTEMFTVLFAIGRLPGWISHWKEMRENSASRIGRPRQVYTGPTERDLP